VIAALRWIAPALVPVILVAYGVYRSDRRRDPPHLVVLTFLLGVAFGAVSFWLEARGSAWTGLDVRSSVVGEASSLLYLFCVVAPFREAAKVAACWPAFLSDRFREPRDGVVYSAVAALGFAAAENVVVLRMHPTGGIWLARAACALPAHLFFATLWGYALGRAKHGTRRPGAIFPMAWVGATLGHGLYTHFVYGRGPGALVAVVPLLLAMGAVAGFASRDLRARKDGPFRELGVDTDDRRPSRRSFDRFSQPPSLHAVRAALLRSDRPIMVRWILFGAVVTLGAMVAGFGASVAFGHWANVDFSRVDEHDVSTVAPLILLGVGILVGFPVSGFLVARACRLPTLLEPALATALAIVATLAILGFAAPIAVIFAVAFSPIAFGLACAGAWIGRPLS
jgi:RsiW-degrading membrane proteinase PrsW (M82 family)